MDLEPGRIEAVLVDSYGTLVDVESTSEALRPYTDDPVTVARIWQLRSREYAIVGNAVDVYRPATERHRHALEFALDVNDVELTDREIEAVMAAYHDLAVYDDVRSGLAAIADRGYPIYILSNGDPPLLDSLVDTANIADVVVDRISAHEIGTYKPARALYDHASTRVGMLPAKLLHVSTSWSDVNGAIAAGLQAAWLNRKDRAWEPYAREPHVTVESLQDLVEVLPDRPAG